MTAFVVIGAVVGAVTLLAIVIIAPSRRVRHEPPLPMRTQLEILLRGRHIANIEAAPEPPRATLELDDDSIESHDDWRFDTAQIQSLRELDGPNDSKAVSVSDTFVRDADVRAPDPGSQSADEVPR